MLRLAQGRRVFMAVAPIDMRKSFDGLCAVVMETLQGNPLDGHLFLFRGKRSDRIKALIWDRNGLAIWYKRLEKGRFGGPRAMTRRLRSRSRNSRYCSTA
jgi:transposase